MAFTLPKEATNRILSLREDRKQAIIHHEFEHAQELENEIASVKSEAVNQASAKLHDEFRQAAITYLTRWRAQYIEIQNKAEDDEFDIRERYERQFLEMQELHKQKLIKAEKEYEDARIREDLRKNPKQELLLEQSRKAAGGSEYATAIRLREESRVVGQNDLESRLVQLDTQFLATRNAMFETFRGEFQQLTSRLTAEIGKVQGKAAQRLQSEEANRKTQMGSLLQKTLQRLGLIDVTDMGPQLEAEINELIQAS
jgi:hypothetical protein